jgi:hypothetical protein
MALALAEVQITGETLTIMKGIDFDEIVAVEVGRHIAETVEATEMTLTTTRGVTLERKSAAIMITTTGEVVRGVIAEIVTGDVRTEGIVKKGDHREIGRGIDREIETGRDPVDVPEAPLLEDQEAGQGSGVIVGTETALASDGHQVRTATTTGTTKLGTCIDEQIVVLVRIYRAEQTAALMGRLWNHVNVAVAVARGAGRVARKSVGLVVEAEVILPALKALPENNCFSYY